MSCKNIGRDAVESYILKPIARPINIVCKSSNFIIIMRRVQSLKQPMVRATCFSFYTNFTRANLCRVSIEQNYTACVSTPLQCERAQINAPAILQETWHVHACIQSCILVFTCKPLPHQAPVQLSAFTKARVITRGGTWRAWSPKGLTPIAALYKHHNDSCELQLSFINHWGS